MGALIAAVLCVSCCVVTLAVNGQRAIWVLDSLPAFVHACGFCNSSQGESDWCPDVTSTHGVQRCTGVGFLLSGGGFCPRRHGEARAGKHGAAAAAGVLHTLCHGVQRCTGVRFLLSGDGFCPRRHGEARAGKHGAAAAASSRPYWPHALASYTLAHCARHGFALHWRYTSIAAPPVGNVLPMLSALAGRWVAPRGRIKHGGLYVLAGCHIIARAAYRQRAIREQLLLLLVACMRNLPHRPG